MRSLAARITVGTLAWLVLAGAAFFLVRTERQMLSDRATLRQFDLRAREEADAIGELRAGQQAYVSAGQGVQFWMPKVGAMFDGISESVNTLRQHAVGSNARAALDAASGKLSDFADADKRARDYMKAGQQLMAADVIFTEGGGAAAEAARDLESARLAEHEAFDANEAAQRRIEASVLAAAACLAALAVLALLPITSSAAVTEPVAPVVPAPERILVKSVPEPPRVARPASASVLKAASRLCTELGRIADADQLHQLIGQAAEMMDASGLIVWVGSAAGADLRPALAYGYQAQTLARMPAVPRNGDNAAAAAYRTGELQIVLSRPGATGAVIAPLLASDGCVGALSAEIRSGGEVSDSVQALATIFAAQIAGIVAVAPVEAAQPRAVAAKA